MSGVAGGAPSRTRMRASNGYYLARLRPYNIFLIVIWSHLFCWLSWTCTLGL